MQFAGANFIIYKYRFICTTASAWQL